MTTMTRAYEGTIALGSLPDLRWGLYEKMVVTTGGVTFQIDRATEDSWLKVKVEHDPLSLLLVTEWIEAAGFVLDDMDQEMMDADGTVTTCLLER